MFKFKMSLLLNNLKFRVAVAILLITAIVAGIVFIPKNNASNISQEVNIKAVTTGISINGRDLYTLSKDGTANGYDNVYCIEQDQDLSYKTYTGHKNLTEASNYFSNYNCAMWVINHMYITTIKGTNGLSDQNARDIAMLNFATAITSDSVKEFVKSKVGVDYKDVTLQKVYNLRNKTTECSTPGSKRNVIELVEQIALWDYTKNKGTPFSSAYKDNPSQYLTGANLTQDEQITLKYIYYALTNIANTMAKTPSTPTISNYITLNKSSVKYDEGKKQFGPYYLEADGRKLTSYNFGELKNAAFPVDAVITNKDGSTVKAGAEIFTKTSDGAFYINLSSYKDAKKVTFNINNIISKISTNGYVSDGGESQNILALEKTLTAMKLTDSQDIPDEVKPEGKYNVELVKTKEDGTTVITSSEATFKINGNETTTTKGVLNIASGKNIANTEQKDEYEIIETKAPEGYDLYNGTIKLTVNFAQEGNKYIIDKDKTSATGLNGKAKIEVSSDKTSIKVYVPNTEKETPKPETPEGKYNVELVKTKEDGTTVITSSEATFKINGKEITTTKGVLNIVNGKNIANIEQKDEYEIIETKAPEGYNLYNGTIKLTVNFAQEGNKYVIDKDKTSATGLNGKAKIEVSSDKTSIKVYVPNTEKEKVFDLSLRKFISKVNGKVVEPSRAPIINEQSIKMLEKTGTASYYHSKNSLSVKIGDEIEYTIRVYNEGEILGYAKQITEYLPEGLSFVKISESSSKEYSTSSKVGSREVILNYNGNKTIKTLRDFIGKEVKVTNEYYQEVKIICKVENTEKVYITNRSEITNYGYEVKSENGETIWKEAKEIGNVDRDSVQNTIKDNLGLDTWYENAKENTYVDENGKTVVDKNYYPGAQDDDDFETVELLTGKYNLIIKKVDSKDQNKKLEGAYFTVKGSNIKDELKIGPTNSNGEVAVVKNVQINKDKQTDEYAIRETVAPENYKSYDGEIKVKVVTKLDGNNFIIDENATKVDGKDVKISFDENKTTITVIIPDEKKDFDLALRKYITEVNGKGLTESREPEVDVSKLASGESTTATYNHSKTPVDVNTSDIVTYTIRVYNEGEVDAYAKKIMDDIPEGLEFIPATYDANGKATNVNAEYKWTLYREMKQGENVSEENKISYKDKTYVVTDKVKEADLIVTDYLSKDSNVNNIIKAFDSKTMKEPDHKDVKVAFKVIEPKESDRIIINYAQITEHTDSNGNPTTDRDSTPNVWKDGEDDQDIEKIKVRYFDLSLLKWVSKAIVYENGNKTITETGHTGYEKPEPVVKVDLQNSNINNVTVKFEYKIKVTNEGEIAGYAKEISDYIPQGLKFEKADNPQWSEKDGKIVTRALENTLLKPGQSAEVTVILTWINGQNNFGLKTNIAEISEDFNEYGTPDKDSTPNNKVPGEDDIDDAPVMLQIRTGKPLVYAGLTAGVLTIIALGVFGIKKRVLR